VRDIPIGTGQHAAASGVHMYNASPPEHNANRCLSGLGSHLTIKGAVSPLIIITQPRRGSIFYLTLVIGFRCNNKAASFRSQAFHMYKAFGVLSVKQNI